MKIVAFYLFRIQNPDKNFKELLEIVTDFTKGLLERPTYFLVKMTVEFGNSRL